MKLSRINKKWLSFLVKHRRLMFNLANAVIPDFPYGEGSCLLDANNNGDCWWEWRHGNDWVFATSWHMETKLLFVNFTDLNTGENLIFDYKVDLLEGKTI